jgi:hypothetical protein
MKKRMKKRRNLTRFKYENSSLIVKNLKVAKYWRRKLSILITRINNEFD